ncbi:MAG: tRNA (cytidine(56)-2'-O)-methyltransferase [Nitrosopumilus sp.]|nr:tRNA (cytidine(56)-2'-O)-methyltransferase [Nitrosopumilus sp.]CAI9830932.1 tRNA (cytidine(56)-2'-O)-methyltransferase [Nitrosopumilaceae archaeon]MDA7944103.1 tRNA (cytidine(56)-2'-O)-methyltransferase [Nitrosopumilus sp.]MDA7944905.1 tRNA (cytidine(56)-2'-O)-methyltransferase [Nitrosopumilus sp.]MDA7955568.1 tRNA (cytidine(56)-2'-O)-methyltransferase [Nitrosopumilus sp.]
MLVEVLRIGQRLVRDDRTTTHAALVARAFGASRILMDDVAPDIRETISAVNGTWGGSFEVEIIEGWRRVLAQKRRDGFAVAHLTMYGEPVEEIQGRIASEERVLAVVGAGKVPRGVYDSADYNVAVGSQPHSEVAALAVFLDRIQGGAQFRAGFAGARSRIIPSGTGKRVVGGPGRPT